MTHRLRTDRIERPRNARVDITNAGRRANRNSSQQVLSIFDTVFSPGASMWRNPCENAEQNSSQTIDVSSGINVIIATGSLLRSHISRRADHASDVGFRFVQHGSQFDLIVPVDVFGLSDFLSESPVENQHLTKISHHDVLRFEIPMNNSPSPRIGNSVTRIAKRIEQIDQVQRFICSCLPLRMISLNLFLQRLTAQKLHRIKRAAFAVGMLQLINRNDVGMLKLTGNLSFLDQPQLSVATAILAWPNPLQSDFTFQRRVRCQPDLTKPAFAVDLSQRVS